MVRRPVLKFTTSRLFLQIISSEAFRPLRSSSKSLSERTTIPITSGFSLKYPVKVFNHNLFLKKLRLAYLLWMGFAVLTWESLTSNHHSSIWLHFYHSIIFFKNHYLSRKKFRGFGWFLGQLNCICLWSSFPGEDESMDFLISPWSPESLWDVPSHYL